MPEDDVCGICRVQFDGTCPTCKYPGDDCTLCKWWFFWSFWLLGFHFVCLVVKKTEREKICVSGSAVSDTDRDGI